MATTFGASSPAQSQSQRTQFHVAAAEDFTTAAEQADAVSEAAILRTVTVLIVGGIVLLGTIGAWVCYGAHQYQNCF